MAMAGLQQFYFFPTDFYYPKPHPSLPANNNDSKNHHETIENLNHNYYKSLKISSDDLPTTAIIPIQKQKWRNLSICCKKVDSGNGPPRIVNARCWGVFLIHTAVVVMGASA